MRNRLVIVGAGGHGKVIADIALKNGYTEIAFADDNAVGVRNIEEKATYIGVPARKIGRGLSLNYVVSHLQDRRCAA